MGLFVLRLGGQGKVINETRDAVLCGAEKVDTSHDREWLSTLGDVVHHCVVKMEMMKVHRGLCVCSYHTLHKQQEYCNSVPHVQLTP